MDSWLGWRVAQLLTARRLLAGLVMLAGTFTASQSHALLIISSDVVFEPWLISGSGSDAITAEYQLALFDPTLGVLNTVQIDLQQSLSGAVVGLCLFSCSETGEATQSVSLNIGTISAVAGPGSIFASANCRGLGCVFFDSDFNSLPGMFSFSGADALNFLGVGTFDLVAAASISADGSGFGVRTFFGLLSGKATVTYDYALAVPEPATLGLFGIGLAGLGLLGWRTRRKERLA